MKRTRTLALGLLLLAGPPACAPAAPPPAAPGTVVQITEWPFWTDASLEESDYDRVWRTVVDVLAERTGLAVMDKEGGYIRTEWKVSQTGAEESRYTLRIRPSERRIRIGVEVRNPVTGAYPQRLRNDNRAPWRVLAREVQDRLGASMTPAGAGADD